MDDFQKAILDWILSISQLSCIRQAEKTVDQRRRKKSDQAQTGRGAVRASKEKRPPLVTLSPIVIEVIDHQHQTTLGKKHFCGFTLLELLIVIAMLGTLAGIAVPAYQGYIERAKIIKAIADISILQKEIVAYKVDEEVLPNTLNDIGRGTFLDPWYNPYQYLNFADVKGKGEMRKDRFLVPLNSDYDLYSMGKDGTSMPPLTAKASHDDIIRANDGIYIGLASRY
jgi:general secretion pathway protein G